MSDLTPASEKLLRDFEQHPEAINYSELSARLWFIEREARWAAPRAATEPPPLTRETLAAALHTGGTVNVNGGLDPCPWRTLNTAMNCPRYHEVQADAILEALATPPSAPLEETHP